MKFDVSLTYPEFFKIEAKDEDEALIMVLEGLPNDESRAMADIYIEESV